MDCSTPGFLVLHHLLELLKLTSIEWMLPPNYLVLCRPLLLLPSIFPTITVFSNESALCIRWPKYWSFSFSISPSSEYLGLISLRNHWFDLLAVQGTLKSLLQHHSPHSSVQLSRSVVSNCLQPHESQHARPPCLSSTPGVYLDSCPSSHY